MKSLEWKFFIYANRHGYISFSRRSEHIPEMDLITFNKKKTRHRCCVTFKMIKFLSVAFTRSCVCGEVSFINFWQSAEKKKTIREEKK